MAKALGREHNIDLSQVSGTGPDNRVIRDDVLEFIGIYWFIYLYIFGNIVCWWCINGSVAANKKTQPAEEKREAAKETKAAPAAAPAPASGDFTDIPVSNIRKVPLFLSFFLFLPLIWFSFMCVLTRILCIGHCWAFVALQANHSSLLPHHGGPCGQIAQVCS